MPSNQPGPSGRRSQFLAEGSMPEEGEATTPGMDPNIPAGPNPPFEPQPGATVSADGDGPTSLAGPSPLRSRTYLGDQARELRSMLGSKPWFLPVRGVLTEDLAGRRRSIAGMGEILVRGYDPQDPGPDDDPDSHYTMHAAYLRECEQHLIQQHLIPHRQLLDWLDSLRPHVRVHATDGERIWPAVGLRWVQRTTMGDGRYLQLVLQLGPSL